MRTPDAEDPHPQRTASSPSLAPWEPASPRTASACRQGRYGKGENGSTTPAAAMRLGAKPCAEDRNPPARQVHFRRRFPVFPHALTHCGGHRRCPRRRAPAHAASATTTPSPDLRAATATMSVGAAMPQSMTTLRTAAFTLANRFAAQAPSLSKPQARNADYLATKMRLPNISSPSAPSPSARPGPAPSTSTAARRRPASTARASPASPSPRLARPPQPPPSSSARPARSRTRGPGTSSSSARGRTTSGSTSATARCSTPPHGQAGADRQDLREGDVRPRV